MVRIHRNDATPRQTVNLISDEEQEPFNSSSNDSDEKPGNSSPSSLSDFIEEDDAPLPVLKSSSSSWEPVRPQRKRLRNLRKKPRLDKIDADDEDSTSSDSTSSDGIPRPQVEVDADDEEDHMKTTPTQPTPKKRKRPHRAAAPPCFLDAVNKFVEPMSKEAKKYQNLTLSQILYGKGEDQAENSDDSSIEYVPCTAAKKAPSLNCESTESDGSGEKELDVEKNHRTGDSCESNHKRRVPKQTRATDSPPAWISRPIQSESGNLSDTEDRNSPEYTRRSSASKHLSKRRRRGKHKSSSDSSYTGEQEACSNVLESERNELRKLNDPEPTGLHRRKSKQVELQNESIDEKRKEEVIDLCSGDECDATKVENAVQNSKARNVHEKRGLVAEHTVRDAVLDIAMTDLSRTEERLQDDVKDGAYSRKDDASTLDAEAPFSFSQNEFASACGSRSSMRHYEGVDFDTMHPRKNRTSAPLPPVDMQQEDLKLCINDSKSWDTKRKIESRPLRCNGDAGCDPIKEPNRKQETDTKAVFDCKTSNLVSKSDPIQKQPTSTRNLGGNTKLDSSTIVGLGPRRRFKGAKQRGNMPHPDVLRRRVPQTQEESRAWLGFAKAEARDIYRAFTGNAPARRYRCANTDMVFVRQILAELGKLMGLKVCSEKEGAGRRIILEKSPLESVRGSEEEAEQAVEGYFYDALADLIDGSNKSKHRVGAISKMKDVNEPPKTFVEVREKAQGTGEHGSALPSTSPSTATSNYSRKREGKSKQNPQVVEKVSKRKTC